MNTFKRIKSLSSLPFFFPTLFLFFFLFSSSYLSQLVQQSLLIKSFDPIQIPFLKTFNLIPQIIFTAILWVVSKNSPFEKVFRGVLLVAIALVSLLFLSLFFEKYLQLNFASETLPGLGSNKLALHYLQLLSRWPTTLLYGLSSFLGFIFSIFTWGFINRVTEATDGFKNYFLYALAMQIIPFVLMPFLTVFKGLSLSVIVPLLIAFLFVALFSFDKVWNKFSEEGVHNKAPHSELPNKFPFVKTAYLLASCMLVNMLLNNCFKTQLRVQIPTSSAYMQFLGKYSFTVSIVGIVVSVLWAVLGTKLIIKSNWRATAVYGSLFVLIGGLIFFSVSAVLKNLSWLNQGVYIAFLTTTKSMLFLPLVQLLYLQLPAQARFRAKITTEMAIIPLMTFVCSLAVQGSTLLAGSVSLVGTYLNWWQLSC